MGSVTELDERRPPTGDDALTCSGCGGHWFDLRIGPGRIGAVTFARDGRVTGYAGTPACRDCGAALAID